MEPVFARKIMVDSRFRKSGTPGNFTFELARAITLPSKCAGFVTDIEMINSWYNVDEHNWFCYIYEEWRDFSYQQGEWPTGYNYITRSAVHRIMLSMMNYSAADLALALKTQINAVLVNKQVTINAAYNSTLGRIVFDTEFINPTISNWIGVWQRGTGNGTPVSITYAPVSYTHLTLPTNREV